MKRPACEVADIIRASGQAFVWKFPQSAHQLRTLQALTQCRTASMGGHVDQCGHCGEKRISYNSCRNRNCPKCQGLARERWMQARERELLAVPYYHVVFTLPHQLNPLSMAHPEVIYPMLFRCAWQTISAFAADPKFLGARAGMVAILHTWGQNLSLHPHIHCIVPGGGITAAGKWKNGRGKGKFLFPVKAMQKVFRAKFLQALTQEWTQGKLPDKGVSGQPLDDPEFGCLRQGLYRKPWVIYAKRPFAGPKQVIEYLGRYTHRIAISNHRIREIAGGKVRFAWKDYRKGGKTAQMTLAATEFLRRFCLHILPHRFVRIRHFGFLASNQKGKALDQARQTLGQEPPPEVPKLDWKQLLKAATNFDIEQCPHCQKGKMKLLGELPRAPPLFRLIPV